MLTAFLIAAAALLLCADRVKALWATMDSKLPQLKPHHYLAAVCLAGAALAYIPAPAPDSPSPAPENPAAPLSLRGLFQGVTASEDAVALAGLCSELASCVEQDGMLDKPRLTTGWAVADLRSAAREIRMAGQSIGERQPLVRDAVHRYLDRPEILGKGGGPIGPLERSKWVAAFRDVSRAAELAVQ